MDKIQTEIYAQKNILQYLNNQKEIIHQNIIILNTKLQQLCNHDNIEHISQYYDKTRIYCVDCGKDL
jgi:hypothetical protein